MVLVLHKLFTENLLNSHLTTIVKIYAKPNFVRDGVDVIEASYLSFFPSFVIVFAVIFGLPYQHLGELFSLST